MADSYTDFLNLTRPEVGASRDAWGDKWNTNATAIDLWAKSVTDTAQAALSRLVANKNDVGEVIPWTVVGPVAFQERISAKQLNLPKGGDIQIGGGAIQEALAGDGTVYATDIRAGTTNRFRVVKTDYASELFRVEPAGAFFGGDKTMWHAGNFTPAEYARKASADVQQFSGDIKIAKAYPTVNFAYPAVTTSGWQVREDARIHFMNFDAGSSRFSISAADGSVATSQFGDLNARIEARGAAFATDKDNSNRAWTTANFLGNAGVGQGTINQNLYISQAGNVDAQWQLNRGGVGSWRGVVDNARHFHLHDVNGDRYFTFNNGGGMAIPQFGDLNSRIEARAANFADDRLNTARQYTRDYAMPINTKAYNYGGLEIQFDQPSIYFHSPGKQRKFLWMSNDGYMRWRDQLGNDDVWRVGPGGDLWTVQFGDLNSRIEARSAAMADDRLNTARSEYNYGLSTKFNNSGGQITGDLTIAKAYPNVTFLWGNVLRAAWQLRENAQMYYINMDNGDAYFSIATDGSVYTKQIGDLNRRIEDRGGAFADDRLNTATARINNKSARLAFLADRNIGSQGRGMDEPYSGGVVTGAAQNNGQGYITDIRYRQLQMSDSNGSWYACGYV